MAEALLTSAITFFVLTIVWNRDDIVNLGCKVFFACMTVWIGFQAFTALGYIVKTTPPL